MVGGKRAENKGALQGCCIRASTRGAVGTSEFTLSFPLCRVRMRFVFAVLVLSVFLPGCSGITIDEQDVFYPKPSVTPQTFEGEDVTLANRFVSVNDSVEVNAWHLTQADAPVTVLFFGGNGFYLVQSKSYLRALTKPGANALLWDYRGYGRSGGAPGVEAFRQDAVAMYDHLVEKQGVDPGRLIVWGHSLGTFLASYVADQRSVAGVVLENPATNVDDWVDHLVPWYVRLFLGVEVDPVLRGENNVDRVREMTAPLLVAAGTDDNVTDPSMAKRLHEVAGSEQKRLIRVEDGTHNGLHDSLAVEQAYADLVDRVVAADSGATTAETRR